MKRNLMLNKTMTQMMAGGARAGSRGQSGSKKPVGISVQRDRTQESIITDNDESVSVMLPINTNFGI